MYHWLAQKGPLAAKHHGWWHPIVTCLIHYAVVSVVTFRTHDFILYTYYFGLGDDDAETSRSTISDALLTAAAEEEDCGQYAQRRRVACAFLLVYAVWLLIWRLVFHHPTIYRHCVLYEYCWLCNVTLTLSAVGLTWNRPIVAGAYCVTVGIDQLLWYVDLAGYFATGRFPIGVAEMLVWEGTTWTSRITATHHLWTIPVLLYASGGMHELSFPLSVMIMITNVLLSRWMIPLSCTITTEKKKRDDEASRSDNENNNSKYLNVNLSHALWKDIKFALLQINHDCPSAPIYLFRLLWRWQVFNSLVFGLLYYLSYWIYGSAPTC